MGPQHGRILQAYFDGEELVIYKSVLYDFTRRKNAPVNLFIQHLANTAVGEIKSFPTASLPERIKGSEVDLNTE